MKYQVTVSPIASSDAEGVFAWLHCFSPDGAAAWLEAF
jgi:hypothetical protein